MNNTINLSGKEICEKGEFNPFGHLLFVRHEGSLYTGSKDLPVKADLEAGNRWIEGKLVIGAREKLFPLSWLLTVPKPLNIETV